MDDSKFSHLNTSNPNIEIQIILVKKGTDKICIIINTYQPPNGDQSEFQQTIDKTLLELHKDRFADIYLLGDLNLDHHYSRKTEFRKNFENLINTFGLIQQITIPTRVTTSTASILDVIYIRTSKKLTPFVKKCSLSDHYLVGCSRFLDYKNCTNTYFYGRSYRNYSREIAQQYYSTLDTRFIFELNDVDLIWEPLLGFIHNCANKFCPKKKIQTRLNQPPWITKEILELIADRDSTFQDAHENNKPQLLPKAHRLRTESKRAMRNARSNLIKQKLDNFSDDPKKFWREINSLIKKAPANASITLDDHEGSPIPPDKIPNHINMFFATIGLQLAEKFDKAPLNQVPSPHSPPQPGAASPTPPPLPLHHPPSPPPLLTTQPAP